MRMWIISSIACGLLFVGITLFKTIKFDTAVSVAVAKGPFQGLSLKVIDYKVSYNDLQVKHEFWDSPLGKAIFNQLSLTLQAIVLASKQYIDVKFDVNYLGLIRRQYQVIEVNGEFDLVAI